MTSNCKINDLSFTLEILLSLFVIENDLKILFFNNFSYSYLNKKADLLL